MQDHINQKKNHKAIIPQAKLHPDSKQNAKQNHSQPTKKEKKKMEKR